jgi:hypothetical protein
MSTGDASGGRDAPTVAFPLIEPDGDEEADLVPADISLNVASPEELEQALDMATSQQQQQQQRMRQLALQVPRTVWAMPPPHALGGPMAMRAMRDALAVQLARRGFDGLRQSALYIVAELAANYLRALGTQLQRESGGGAGVGAASGAAVRRIQRHAQLHDLSEWRQAQISFTRVAEPAQPGLASRSVDLMQRQGVPPPAAVAPLYTAMKGVWNYKHSGPGRTQHAEAGKTDTPSASNAPLPPNASAQELSGSLRLSKKQRQLTEAWLQGTTIGAHTAPVLLPGPLLGPDGAVPDAAAAAPRGRNRKGRQSGP